MTGGQISYDLRRLREPGLTRHPATTSHQPPLTPGTSRNTQPKLTRPVKSLRGKVTYATSQAHAEDLDRRMTADS